jgi:hypothetical protein
VFYSNAVKGKGKAVLLQAWSGLEGSRKLRSPYFLTTAQDGGKFVSLTHRPHLPQEILPVLISVNNTKKNHKLPYQLYLTCSLKHTTYKIQRYCMETMDKKIFRRLEHK